jgi:hypothetical protein
MILNMRVRFCLVLLAASVLLAQTQMNVEQLADFIRSELALKQHSDKQIAAGVRELELSEKLTDKTIIDLQAQGAGPKTVDALRALRDKTANMKPPAHDATSSPATASERSESSGSPTAQLSSQAPTIPPPDSVRQQEILQSMRDYAMNYTKNLPNFFCVEVTRQFVDPNGGSNYRSNGTILAKVGYNEGTDHYNVYSVNNKLVDTTMDEVKTGGAVSTGEFGSMMREIFEPDSQAEFNWDHWAKLRTRKMAVFSYFIDSAHSKWWINYGDKADGQRIVTAYKGLVYADANTGEVTRIKFEAVDIPRTFPINSVTDTLDYDLQEIGGQQFVVPLTAKLFMKAGRESSKNEIEFRNYRKYETGSSIKYDLDPNAPPPLPETQEQPTAAGPAKPATPTTQNTPPKKDNPWILPTPPPPPPQ